MVHSSVLKFLLMRYSLMNEMTCIKIETQHKAIDQLSVGNAF